MMGEASNSNPNCNRTAAIVYNGQTFHGTLQDKCMGCVSYLEISQCAIQG